MFLEAGAEDLTGFPGPVGPSKEQFAKAAVGGVTYYLAKYGATAGLDLLEAGSGYLEYYGLYELGHASLSGARAAIQAGVGGTCQ